MFTNRDFSPCLWRPTFQGGDLWEVLGVSACMSLDATASLHNHQSELCVCDLRLRLPLKIGLLAERERPVTEAS